MHGNRSSCLFSRASTNVCRRQYEQPWTESGGNFEACFNVHAGVIAVINVHAPVDPLTDPEKSPPAVPPPRRLSDFLFLVHQKLCADNGEDDQCLQRLQWVLHDRIVNDETNAVTDWIYDEAVPEFWPSWPGHTFVPYSEDDVSSDRNAKALVGSPNGRGTAYLLSQHSTRYGSKTIDEIRVFGNDHGLLCLGWHISSNVQKPGQ